MMMMVMIIINLGYHQLQRVPAARLSRWSLLVSSCGLVNRIRVAQNQLAKKIVVYGASGLQLGGMVLVAGVVAMDAESIGWLDCNSKLVFVIHRYHQDDHRGAVDDMYVASSSWCCWCWSLDEFV